MGAPIMTNLKLMAVNLIAVCLLLVLVIDSSSSLRLPNGERTEMSLDRRLRRTTSRISPMSSRFKALMLKKSTMNASNDRNDWRFWRKPSSNENVSRKMRTLRKYFFGARSWAKKSPRRFRRDEQEKSIVDLRREEYERKLFESLRIIGNIPATRLYVREDPNLVPEGTVVGNVRKLHPYGKVRIVWPYKEFRNFTVNEDTGDVTTTDLMDFELIRIYNMTIRDFQYNYTYPEGKTEEEHPPMPDPPSSTYVDHYLIVEVVDLNDNEPKFLRDIGGSGQFYGRVNRNARAGTPILQLHPVDDDSGPRGRIRYEIVTRGNKETPFTIDPKTHILKTNGKPLETIQYQVEVIALDYGMPPKTSGTQLLTVVVEKAPPEFVETPYNLNFSEALVRGSVVARVRALSRSGMPMTYEILEAEAKETFAINHLGEITLLRELDYDTANESDKIFRFRVRAKEDADEGQPSTIPVNLFLVNADDHLGTFKTPATKLRMKEGGDPRGGDVFTVEVDDCDCKKNCRCGSNEMKFELGDTSGFFRITDDGQIQNDKVLDYETKNYFFFLVNVTDPGTNGRTRTSYIEVYVEDIDDTPPQFLVNEFNFFIFEDAPKGQVVGVAQAVDPDPSTKPDDVSYSIHSADKITREYFKVGNQGVITVHANTDHFKARDRYEMVIKATDSLGKVSDPRATVIIRVLDVNDHQPEFSKCVKQKIKENQKIGTVLTTLKATDQDRGLNKLIEYSIQRVQKDNYFTIDNATGVVTTTHVLDRESYDSVFVVAKATDGGSARSDALRQIGYCQFIVEVEDVNDHHPQFTVATFDVSIKQDLGKNQQVLLVVAVDPDLGENAVIKYRIKSQKKQNDRSVDYFKINEDTGSLEVKNSLSTSSLSVNDKISVTVQAYNTVPVVLLDPNVNADAQSFTTVIVSFTTKKPLTFTKAKYVLNNVLENIGAGIPIMTLSVGGSQALFALQSEIRDRENLPFTVDSTSGKIITRSTLNYEKKKSYLFAVTATAPGSTARSSAIVQINIQDVDDEVPIFGNDRYDATLSEAAKGGANVFRVKATDPDLGAGQEIKYTIEAKYDYKIFTIEKKSNYAQIKTRADIAPGFFDREKKEVYTIVVEAHSQNLKSTASVIIKVRDENDSPPVFVQKFYNASIPEGLPDNVKYTVPGLKVMALDKDILENANVSYFITSGNDGRFEMKTVYDKDQKNYGELVVVRSLDVEKSPAFQKNPVYVLTVTATDRKHTDEATITIKVLDRPETRPEFVEDYYEKYLPENVGAGVNVVHVQVKKPENVEFILDDIAKPYFTINKLNGLIKTGGELLDWEKTPVITFPVYAYDKSNPSERGQTFVRVKLNDVNDAHPHFPDQPYVGYVLENQKPNTPVRYINGKDSDNPDVNFGNNVKLRYELLTNTGGDPWDKDGRLFKFDSEGLLVTKVTFNVEEYRRNLTVRVRAWDNGNPKLYGDTDVTIVIRDVNEFPALFRKPRYEASVLETQPPGFVVLQLTVKDRDFAPLDNYAFSMLNGNQPYAFDIRQETGEIVVAGVLDYEDGNKQYKLRVGLAEKSDEFLVPGDGVNITVPFQDFAEVFIDIIPGNDNRPTFTSPSKIYTAVVPENIKVGTALNISIQATDGDKGFSNRSRFLITKGNLGDWFGVKKDPRNLEKAIVFIQYPLDREYKSVYDMELIVKDNGGVFDTAKLLVTVTDVNDNAPVFQPSFYRATITEPRCTDQLVTTLIVTDPDKSPQGPFSFAFAPGGNPGNRFALRSSPERNNATELYCNAGVINRESTPNFVVIIRATDNPSPRRTSTAKVFINVEDVDDNPARNARMTILVNAIDGKFGGGPVGKTYFQDDDADGLSSMEYTLGRGSDEFTVKRDTGWINAKSTVKVGKYQLEIHGRKGSQRPKSVVDINIREVPADAIRHSAAIQLNDLWDKNSFLNPIDMKNIVNSDLTYYDRFVDMLADLFYVPKERVFVFSIQMSAMVLPGKPTPSVDVRFAIQKESPVKSKFLPRTILINVLEKNNETLKELGFKLGMIGIDYCANETLRVGMCNNDVISTDTYSVVSSDYGLMPAPNYAQVIVSIDTAVDGTYSRYKTIPDPEYDTCEDDYCLNGGTCHDVKPHGFVCECPNEYSGPRCQLTTRTFLGSSYIWLRPKTPYNYGSVSFEFATEKPNGLLLYQGPAVKDGNNGRKDFLAVSLVKGTIKLALSFGGEPLVFNLGGKRLNDRKWHHVEISHERKDVTLTIDHCKYADIVEDDERIVEKREKCETISRTMLNFEYLNGLGPIQVGGIENMPLEYPSSKYVEYTYFTGCIRKIRDNLEMYDLGYPVGVVNSPVGCTLMAECPECLNGGYCEPGFTRSVCTCAMGFIGDDCSGNAPRFYYMANSFTEYKLPGEERRRKRSAANEPQDLLDRYASYIAMQIRVDPAVKKAYFLYVTSETNMEYSILGYEEQKLYFEFKMLDALSRLEMPGEVEVADGNWHNVIVTREGNVAVLQVDYKGRVSRNTGGAKRLIRMSSALIYVGGEPSLAPNATILNKTVEAKITDIRARRRRSAGTIIGVTSDGRPVKSVEGDMTGCTGSSTYNGKNLDTDPNVKAIRFNVEAGCPCIKVIDCFNGGVCVSAAVPYCLCTRGWSGPTCEDIVYIAPVLGNRIDGRARWKDGGVLIVILCVVLCVLVLAVALLFVKKRREAPYSLPVGDEGQDSIMPYHDEGAGEEDTFNYDIHHLMKYSYRDGHGTVTKPMNGKDVEHVELLTRESTRGLQSEPTYPDGVDLWPFIQERVQKADEDMDWWPGDEMRHWEDEGDDEEEADLSEIGESDEEAGADVEQDWDFLKDWGRKFENLNKIFNPDDDDDDDEEA